METWAETLIGNHVDSDNSTDDGEDDLVVQVVGQWLPRKCQWIIFAQRLLFKSFSENRDHWPVCIRPDCDIDSRWSCYRMITALRVLDIDPSTPFTMRIRGDVKMTFTLRPLSSSPVTVQQRNDVKMLFAVNVGEFLHRVRPEATYYTYVQNPDLH